MDYTDPAKFLAAVEKELPYQSVTGLKIKTLTDDPNVRKAVDDMMYDLFGEKNPWSLSDYEQPAAEPGMTMGGL